MKKVLISFGQLRKLCSPDNCRPPNDDYLAAIMGARMSKWFDAQPDVAPIMQDYEATKNLFKGAIPMLDEGLAKLEAAISKMETTE